MFTWQYTVYANEGGSNKTTFFIIDFRYDEMITQFNLKFMYTLTSRYRFTSIFEQFYSFC